MRYYLDVFTAWDVAAALRRDERRLIESIEMPNDPPAEWSLVRDWLAGGDQPFFEEVLNDSRLKAVLDQHGFDRCDTEGRILGRNNVLKITKASRSLTGKGPGPETVNIHFEARERGELRLDVEVAPYEGSIANRPDRMADLKPLLKLKASVLAVVRSTSKEIPDPENRLGITFRGLRRAEKPSTLTAARFDIDLGTDCTPEEHAAFVADVIDAVTPVVDRPLQGHELA